MRIGLQIPSFTWPGGPAELGERLRAIATTADDAGFSSLWVMDHLFQIPLVGPVEQEMLEGYGALHFLAGVTRQATLGTMVTGVTYRHPGMLVKAVTTLDVLSRGRAMLGIGAAWFDREHHGLGIPFPPLGERFERLEEALQITKQMWSDDDGPYQGTHYQLKETLCVPPPIQRPHPPILIGGGGEKKTLRLVARYGDACNLFGFLGPDGVRGKLDVLARHCDDLGRDAAAIENSVLQTVNLARGQMSASDVVKMCSDYAALGVDHMIFNMPNTHELTPLETFGKEIIPATAEL